MHPETQKSELYIAKRETLHPETEVIRHGVVASVGERLRAWG